jgi:hypothetical protein
VNACVDMLLNCVHGSYLWMDMPISIDTNLIALITCLPSQGEDPTLMFVDKKNDKTLLESMRLKFHIVRGVCGLDVSSICDPTIRIATK